MGGQYYKHFIMVSLVLGLIPMRVLSRTLQEDIEELSKTTDSGKFAGVLQRISFRDIFNNDTVKGTLSPEYKKEYLEMIARTIKLVEIIDVDSLMEDFHSARTKTNVTNMVFLEMVLDNIDALKAVNLVEWSNFVMQNDGGKVS